MGGKKLRGIKQKLFDIYAHSALCSGYSQEEVYFCPLCKTRFESIDGLTLDHAPPKVLALPSVEVLTCDRCNSDSGTAQDRLHQAHLFHQFQTNKPTKPQWMRLTLGALHVRARVWKDVDGILQIDVDPKHNNPKTHVAFLRTYQHDEKSGHLTLNSIDRLNQPLIRWALAREAFLLLFYYWGYWLLKNDWASAVQDFLKESDSPLPPGSIVEALEPRFAVSPTNGEFIRAQTPSGYICWLVPIVDNRWVVMPSADPAQDTIALWNETERMTTSHQAFAEVTKIIVNRNVKNSNEWVIVERHEPTGTPDFWVEIVPAAEAQQLLNPITDPPPYS